MYQFYGIIDRSAHRHEGDHRQSIATLRKKFPSRAAGFDLIQRKSSCCLAQLFVRRGSAWLNFSFVARSTTKRKSEVMPIPMRPRKWSCLNCFFAMEYLHLTRINGSFMIIILEHDSGRCRIINDQMGTRQVFYYAADDFIVFGSELKFLFCHPRCPRTIDWTASLKRHIPFLIINAERQYEAWFKDIKLLEEGSILEMPPSGPHTVIPYWNPWQTRFTTT